MRRRYREIIRKEIEDLPVFDTHEHCWESFSRRKGRLYDLPIFTAMSYLVSDLNAAGYKPEPDLFSYAKELGTASEAVRIEAARRAWEAMKPSLVNTRNTTYYRYYLENLRELFGIEEAELYSEDWRRASEKVYAYSKKQRGGGEDLCDRLGIRALVLDAKYGKGFIAPVETSGRCRILQVIRMGMYIHEERGLKRTLERHPDKNFGDWLDRFEGAFAEGIAAGAVGFKCGLAYNRRIDFSSPSHERVARIFDAGVLSASPEEKTLYQDYMVNRLCELCAEKDIPFQIHTGIQSGSCHSLEDTKPTLLTGLFQRHRDLRIDLFHGGYPWCVQAGLMAKYFPKVHINGCWLHHISPSAYRAALKSWLETVPMSKIFAWGGDHTLIESSAASLRMAKSLVADVLEELVREGHLDLELALTAAGKIFYENPARFWGLSELQHRV